VTTPERTAEVRVADLVTRYVRRGAGRPVVVLRAHEDADALWPELLDAVASRGRVLIPDVLAPDASFVAWVRGFLDGLGLPSVALVATGRFCVPALELALLDPDRLDALVLVPRGRSEETGLSGVLGGGERPGIPLLVLRREASADEAVRLIGAHLKAD
jgi:hypothetical protein